MYEFSIVCIGIIAIIEIVRLVHDFNLVDRVKKYFNSKN